MDVSDLHVGTHRAVRWSHICMRTRPEDLLLIMRCAAKAFLIVEGTITAVTAAANGAAAGLVIGVVLGVVLVLVTAVARCSK